MTSSQPASPTVLLDHYLKQLKLPSMHREYKSLAATCATEKVDYQTYLLRLTERELIDRERRSAERRIKAAHFPVQKTLESFDFLSQPSLNKSLIRELARGDYIDQKENILLVGSVGTGKTHLACALGFAACAQGRRVRFFTVSGLVTHLLEKREERTLEKFLNQLERHHLLILDELGYVPFSKAGAELIFEVISRAYERTSLIVTTNLPFEEWTEVLGSERLTGALLDRLTHRVHILEANGKSYRLREAQKRLKRTTSSMRRPTPVKSDVANIVWVLPLVLSVRLPSALFSEPIEGSVHVGIRFSGCCNLATAFSGPRSLRCLTCRPQSPGRNVWTEASQMISSPLVFLFSTAQSSSISIF